MRKYICLENWRRLPLTGGVKNFPLPLYVEEVDLVIEEKEETLLTKQGVFVRSTAYCEESPYGWDYKTPKKGVIWA